MKIKLMSTRPVNLGIFSPRIWTNRHQISRFAELGNQIWKCKKVKANLGTFFIDLLL